MIKYIKFLGKDRTNKSVATVVKYEDGKTVLYPRNLENGDYTAFWLTVNAQMGRVSIRTGYRLNIK